VSYYRRHIFFCTNLREDGRPCCQDAGAAEARAYAKQRIKDLGLAGEGGVRVNTSGCLDRCAEGPVAVVYPEGVWYTLFGFLSTATKAMIRNQHQIVPIYSFL